MDRKEFLKRGFSALGFAVVTPLIMSACGKTDNTDPTACVDSPSETAGPFPTKSPTSFVIKDIKSDRTGVPLTVNITIQNVNKGCAALEGALVDIWHCDKDGNYSEYGSLTAVHFLRGRQTSGSDGVAAFSSIFPGWYPGRAPHIHVHVFNATGKSLLVTQIAFPTDICDTVYKTATSFYTKGTQDTSNKSDNQFADSLASNLCTLSGTVAGGYTLSHIVKVSA
jgi:protocatechuate 3,4-dioxygenase beta subunit